MKRYCCLLGIFVFMFGFINCGDNKTKEKLINGTIVTGGPVVQLTPVEYTAATVARNANIVASLTSIGIKTTFPSQRRSTAESQASYRSSSDGFLDFSAFYPGVSIKFYADEGKTTLALIPDVADPWIILRVNASSYSGEFTAHQSALPYKTITEGTITSPDPLGGNFTSTISNVPYTTVVANTLGLPIGGTLSLSSPSGTNGTFTFSGTAGVFTCTGTMTFQQETIAISLIFDTTAKKYAGSYTDAKGSHSIPQLP